MPRFTPLLTVLPMLFVTGALFCATAFIGLLNSPEIAIRAALSGPTTEVVADGWGDGQAMRPGIAAVVDDLDESLPGLGRVQPLTQTGGFDVGDRLTISRAHGQLRTFEVTKVRRVGPLLDKVADEPHSGNWALIVARDVRAQNRPELRFLVQEGGELPFGMKRETVARSL